MGLCVLYLFDVLAMLFRLWYVDGLVFSLSVIQPSRCMALRSIFFIVGNPANSDKVDLRKISREQGEALPLEGGISFYASLDEKQPWHWFHAWSKLNFECGGY